MKFNQNIVTTFLGLILLITSQNAFAHVETSTGDLSDLDLVHQLAVHHPEVMPQETLRNYATRLGTGDAYFENIKLSTVRYLYGTELCTSRNLSKIFGMSVWTAVRIHATLWKLHNQDQGLLNQESFDASFDDSYFRAIVESLWSRVLLTRSNLMGSWERTKSMGNTETLHEGPLFLNVLRHLRAYDVFTQESIDAVLRLDREGLKKVERLYSEKELLQVLNLI